MLEILAPAGNMECALVAIGSGADALYLGLDAFSARQSAGNFDKEGLSMVLEKAHFAGVKVYVAMNTLVKEEELDLFMKSLLFAWNSGVDAIILQDILLGKRIHEAYPEIVLHLSTQAGVCQVEGAKFAKECGFSRVILARETPLEESKKIACFMETEVFVQGALCTCYSGQCYFSSFAGGNSGNRGRCKQPCRKLYAYDRNGNTEKSYALSLSDLSVGEEIQKFIDAGVISFKIEGRMRRAEYVGAAVKYYRTILDEKGNTIQLFSDLKRTYNRGNYTKGLAFGQDKRFLSTAIQGHIGEKIGVVKVVNGKFFVESKFMPRQGDAFKILRDGKEIGGASFSKAEGRGFTLFSKHRLKNGDGVFITTDTSVNERAIQGEINRKLPLRLFFTLGKSAVIQGEGITFESEEILEEAQNCPLTEIDLKNCFSKTDGLPVEVIFEEIRLKGNIFLPKSKLNNWRRSFYTLLKEAIVKGERKGLEYASWEKIEFKGKNDKVAVIAEDFTNVQADVAIYKAKDMKAPLPDSFVNGSFEKYLYCPAFYTTADMESLYANAEGKIDGLYVENYGWIPFAQRHHLKIFGGTGLNLFNPLSIEIFLGLENVAYYAISKELNTREGSALISENSFVLSAGNIKIMELCYCPFGKTCAKCDKKEVYTLTDENDRVFPVRRYLSANGECRFEVYNCADLIGIGIENAGKLLDLTLVKDISQASQALTEVKQKEIFCNYTSGHSKRGVL